MTCAECLRPIADGEEWELTDEVVLCRSCYRDLVAMTQPTADIPDGFREEIFAEVVA